MQLHVLKWQLFLSIYISSIHDRVFIDDHKYCQLLKIYASTATNNDILARYLASDVDNILTCLAEHCPVVADLIFHPIPCPYVCSSFFSDLSTKSPVYALLTPSPQVINLMSHLCNGLEVRKFPERWKFLQDHVPILHDLLCKLGPENTMLPLEYRPLVISMMHKAQVPFACTPLHPCIPASADSALASKSYFPHLPVLWEQRKYTKLIKKRCIAVFKIVPQSSFSPTWNIYCLLPSWLVNCYIHYILFMPIICLYRDMLWLSADALMWISKHTFHYIPYPIYNWY